MKSDIITKIKVCLINICKNNVFFRKVSRKMLLIYKKSKYLLYNINNKTNDKTILFEAFGGRNYTCSPKAIYEKMLSMPEFNDYTFVWAFIDPKKHDILKDGRTKIVISKSKEYNKYCSISKYWIVNSIMPEYITKKKRSSICTMLARNSIKKIKV